MNLRISGPEGNFMATSTHGSAMYALMHTRTNSSATTASRYILMKMSTLLTMEKSGFSASDATSGITLIAKQRETTTRISEFSFKITPTSAFLAPRL
jgi:hypothetical protein